MLTYYTDKYVPQGSRGCARGPVIFIRPKYKDDRGLLEHEKVHVHQFWTGGLFIHSFRYLFSKAYKLACEVEAYKEQAQWYPDDRLPKFAGFISRDYGLKISEDDVLKLLREET